LRHAGHDYRQNPSSVARSGCARGDGPPTTVELDGLRQCAQPWAAHGADAADPVVLNEVSHSGEEHAMTKRTIHGIEIRVPREPVRPISIDLSGPEGERVVRSAVRRVMATHAKVIKALAKR
jgi:hypothetical protein